MVPMQSAQYWLCGPPNGGLSSYLSTPCWCCCPVNCLATTPWMCGSGRFLLAASICFWIFWSAVVLCLLSEFDFHAAYPMTPTQNTATAVTVAITPHGRPGLALTALTGRLPLPAAFLAAATLAPAAAVFFAPADLPPDLAADLFGVEVRRVASGPSGVLRD